MDPRIQGQYELWACSELYPAEGMAEQYLHSLLGGDTALTDAANAAAAEIQEAAFAGGFSWAAALHDAALDAAHITVPRLNYLAGLFRARRDTLFREAGQTTDDIRFARCSAAAEACGHAYRLIEPMGKGPSPNG